VKQSAEIKRLKERTSQIEELSLNETYKWTQVPKGARLHMPDGKPDYEASSDMPLRDVAIEVFGRDRKAAKIFSKNKDAPSDEDQAKGFVQLQPVTNLPAGAELSMPVEDWPAWAAFAGLAVLLLLVGAGFLIRPSKENDNGPNDVGTVSER
jgi:hypothetical protein